MARDPKIVAALEGMSSGSSIRHVGAKAEQRVLKDTGSERARIAELEAKLAAAEAKLAGETVCVAGKDKHGNDVLKFSGNFMPFEFTRAKCNKIAPFAAQIVSFAKGK